MNLSKIKPVISFPSLMTLTTLLLFLLACSFTPALVADPPTDVAYTEDNSGQLTAEAAMTIVQSTLASAEQTTTAQAALALTPTNANITPTEPNALPSETPTLVRVFITTTPVPTNTPSGPSVTATLDVTDPKTNLGYPDLKDDFSGNQYFYTYETTSSKAEIKDGQFWYTMFQPLPFSEWTLAWMNVQDFYAEVTATTPAVCSGLDRYGLMFHAPDVNQGYMFSLTCAGTYRLISWDGTNLGILVGYIESDAINAGPTQTNRLGVRMVGNTISLYINGQYIRTITNNTFLDAGRFGLIVGSENTLNFVVKFDDFAYWEIP